MRFDRFSLDLQRGCLLLDDRPVELRPKSFKLLQYFVEHPERLIPKDELVKAVWRHAAVTDDSLARCVSEVRLALGDAHQRIIKTVPRRGYVLAVPVRRQSVHSRAAKASDLPLPDRPSIAVLPFVNLSADPAQDYLSDGISEDLITALGKFTDLFVIAPNSALRYKASPPDARNIGRQLGVRYLLQGSIRRVSQRIRITARLVDSTTGNQRWAEHYDREMMDVFAVQDEVVRAIATTLVAQVTRSELERARRKPPQKLTAYEYYLRGNAIFRNVAHGDRAKVIAEARRLYRMASVADPGYAPPLQALGNTYIFSWLEPVARGRLRSEYGNEAIRERALQSAARALELDRHLPEAHATLGWVLHWHWRRPEALASMQRALELNPNLADGRHSLMLIHGGRAHEGIEAMKRIMRLDPFHPPLYLTWLATAYYLTGEYEAAYQAIASAAASQPNHRPSFVWLAACSARLGREEEARRAAREVLRIDPQFSIARFLALIRYARQADEANLAEGLRRAGLK